MIYSAAVTLALFSSVRSLPQGISTSSDGAAPWSPTSSTSVTTTSPYTTTYSPSTTAYPPTSTPYPTTSQYLPSTSPYQPTTTPYSSSTKTSYPPTTTPYTTTTPYVSSTTPYSTTTPYSKPSCTCYPTPTPYSSSTPYPYEHDDGDGMYPPSKCPCPSPSPYTTTMTQPPCTSPVYPPMTTPYPPTTTPYPPTTTPSKPNTPTPSPLRATFDLTFDNKAGSLNGVACSNGENGLAARFPTFGDLPSFPFIGGAFDVAWNSPNCGACWALTNRANGVTINITAVDTAGAGFNIAKEAFDKLAGAQSGLGAVDVVANKVSPSVCGL